MNLTVEKANLDSDRSALIRFLKENLTEDSNEARYEWLYRQNPAGQAKAWIAYADGQIAGVAAAFPRDFWVYGKTQRVWVLGDFCMARACRSLGPALQLQRACVGFLDRERWYDFPSRKMMAIYKRLGIETAAESVRYTKLLRLDSKVEELVPGLPVARTISRAGNSLLRLRSTLSRSTDFQVEPYNGVFGEEFDRLNSSSVEAGWIHGQRTAAFLNWRFRDCPLSEHVAVTARRAGLLLGYAIATIAGTQATLGDIRTSMSKAFGALLNGMEDVLRDKGIHTWNTPLFAGPDVANSVRHAGFHPRESSPVVFGDGGHSQWLLLASDRDS